MTEYPVFKPVETTNMGKTTIYWGSAPTPLDTRTVKGTKIILDGRVRTIKHMDRFKRVAQIGEYIGLSVYNDGESYE